MSDLPRDVRSFLEQLVQKFIRGERDEAFAEWAAATASFLLEYRGLLY